MSIKRNKGGDKDSKSFSGKDFGAKNKMGSKGGKPGAFKKGADIKPKVRTSKNSDFDVFDKDELAPPRFMPKRSDSKFGDRKPRSGDRKAYSDDRKPNDRKRNFDDRKPGDKKSYNRNDDRKSYGKSDERKSYGKSDERKSYGKSDERKSYGRPDDRKSYGRPDDRKSYNKTGTGSRPGKDRSYRLDKDGDNTKKPFRPKYDPEVKVRKSYRERKEALVGPTPETDDVRLNKYLANAGICSRREADDLIAQGLVTVNGQVVTEMGYKVKKEDVVKYDGRKILPEPYVYILMNKPKDFITTTEDDKGRKTVMDLLADKVPQRVFPIGRLDRNTTGVLLLTNDGEVAQALTHPSFEIKKVYHVVLDKKVSGNELDKLVSGIDLEDGTVFADAATFVDNEDRRHVGIEIHSGKNRVVRRMFEALGYDVEKLDRVSMGIFTKKDLPRGKWRFLTQSEIGFLMKLKSKIK